MLERVDNQFFDIFTGRQTEFFTKRHTNSRRHLNDRDRLWIIDHIKHAVCFVFFTQSPGRAKRAYIDRIEHIWSNRPNV